MSNSKGSNVLLTIDDVRGWKREREMAAARILELDKKLSLVAAFLPEEVRIEIFGTAQLPGDPKVRDDRAALSKFISEALGNEKKGRSVHEIEGIALNSEHRDFIKENPGVIEDVLLSSARKGRLRKRGDLFFHPATEEIAPREEISNPEYGAAEYFRSIVIKAAERRRDGMSTAEIVSVVKSDPRGAQKIAHNAQYAYSLLGRMIAKDFLKKVDGRLYIPSFAPVPGSTSPNPNSETAADSEESRAAIASEPPAGAQLLPFAAQAAE